MNNIIYPIAFVPIRRAASVLGVPVNWLEREAHAGRIPAIKAGRRWLIHLERTRSKLTELADQAGEVSDE